MWRNYLKITLRNILKYRLHSFINITGLSIAIALSILIFLFIADEFSFDRFHPKKNFLYMVEAKQYTYGEDKSIFDEDGDGIWRVAWMPTPMGPTMAGEIPEIVNYTRWDSGDGILIFEDRVFKEEITFIDPGFFSMFGFELIHGDPSTVMADKSQLVITEGLSEKCFGDRDALGKSVRLNISGVEKDFIVSGIIENPPPNSSLSYSLLVLQENKPWYDDSYTNWQSFNNPTFIELSEKADRAGFSTKLARFRDKYFAETINENRERENLEEDVPVLDLLIQPITEIHLDPELSWYKSSDPAYSRILAAIGLLILVIASINYISLSLSNASSRSREVGIRKVLGANPMSLRKQFWGESMLLVFISLISGIGVAVMLLKPFNDYTGKSLSLINDYSLGFLAFLIFLVLMIGVIAGGYPAIYLSRFHPVKVLKSGTSTRFNTTLIRVLVILQYSLSAFLIISSVIMYRQMDFVTGKDLGYDKEQVVVIPTFTGWSDEGETALNRMNHALFGRKGILAVSGTSASFNRGWSRNGFKIEEEEHSAFTYRVDERYLETLGIRLVEGRDFDPGRPSDIRNAILVNEALARDMGWENPVGQELFWRKDSSCHQVIGVVANYHFRSLENEIEPVILYIDPGTGKITTLLAKISPVDIPATLSLIEKTWKTIYPNKPFEYSFLDEDVQRQYSNYLQWMKIMGTSTLLAIFIACLGLFGLSAINAVNRIKEVSIRKILGATGKELFLLMNREVMTLSVISFLIAIPASFMIMRGWLDSFEYRIVLSLPVFLIPVLTGIFIALVTVSYHALQVTLANPADTLRDE